MSHDLLSRNRDSRNWPGANPPRPTDPIKSPAPSPRLSKKIARGAMIFASAQPVQAWPITVHWWKPLPQDTIR